VVVGSFNRRRFLAQAIESVRQNGAAARSEIIAVDGGSTDGTIPWLMDQKDVVSIVQHNRGTFRGQPIRRRSWGYFMNLGFKCAQGRYILMISDDCLLIHGAIDSGIAHCDRLAAEGHRVGGGAFYFRNWPNERDYYVQRTFGGKLMVNHGLFSRDAMEAVGWVDEDRYQFYKADGDLCLKIWQAGYEIVDCPDAYVEHFEGANPEIRKSNREVLVRDRAAYRDRWEGVFWDPAGPELRDRIERAFVDPHQTARLFPREGPIIAQALSRRARRTGQRVRTRLAGLVHA